jgi:hypothetical protein
MCNSQEWCQLLEDAFFWQVIKQLGRTWMLHDERSEISFLFLQVLWFPSFFLLLRLVTEKISV